MRVNIKLFGNLGHYLPEGSNSFSIEKVLDEETTVQEMVKDFNIPKNIAVLAVINGRQVSEDYILRDGDEITLFRPTGGG